MYVFGAAAMENGESSAATGEPDESIKQIPQSICIRRSGEGQRSQPSDEMSLPNGSRASRRLPALATGELQTAHEFL